MIRPFRGRTPDIHPLAFIVDSAEIIGDVVIGRESSMQTCIENHHSRGAYENKVLGNKGFHPHAG
jgi:carbonic anhydrase/acetyltransferase-like protein (isoleucine patch superfamily)